MKCKAGDLAIIAYPKDTRFQKYIGTIVKCVAPSFVYGESWITDPSLTYDGGEEIHWKDYVLTPIKDIKGEDESLTWVSKHKCTVK